MIRFGACVYEPATRRLIRDGIHVELSPKAFDLLGLLLESRPRILGKDELRDRLWPKTFVGDTSLAKLVAELRKAIGDARRGSRYIRTVHRFGYAFCGEAVSENQPREAIASVPAVRAVSLYCLHWGSRDMPLFEGPNLIGRDPECEVRIPSHRVSRRHARISIAGEQAILEDLGSKNGTAVRTLPVETPTVLADGDRILLGEEPVMFLLAAPTGPTETAP